MSPVGMVLTLAVVNQTAVQAARVLLALYLLELGAGPLTVGLLASTFSACPALLSVPMGRLSDRIGPRKPMTAGALVACAGMLLPFFLPNIATIIVGATMVGMSTAIFNVSLQSLVGLFSTPQNRTRNFSNYSMANSSASLLGPLIAGFSIDHMGHALACLTVAIMLVIPLGILAVSKMSFRGEVARAPHKKGHIRDLIAGPGMRRTLVTGSMQNVSDSLFLYYMPVYLHSISLSASAIGIVLAMNAAAAFVARFTLPGMIRQLGEKRVLVLAFYLGATALVLIPFFQNAVLLGAISFMFGLGMGCTGPMVNMMMFANSPPGRSGEAMGLKVTVNHFTKVVSPVVLGTVAGAAGLAPVFWITAVLLGSGGWVNRREGTARINTPPA